MPRRRKRWNTCSKCFKITSPCYTRWRTQNRIQVRSARFTFALFASLRGDTDNARVGAVLKLCDGKLAHVLVHLYMNYQRILRDHVLETIIELLGDLTTSSVDQHTELLMSAGIVSVAVHILNDASKNKKCRFVSPLSVCGKTTAREKACFMLSNLSADNPFRTYNLYSGASPLMGLMIKCTSDYMSVQKEAYMTICNTVIELIQDCTKKQQHQTEKKDEKKQVHDARRLHHERGR
jgi:hypothetical protein